MNPSPLKYNNWAGRGKDSVRLAYHGHISSVCIVFTSLSYSHRLTFIFSSLFQCNGSKWDWKDLSYNKNNEDILHCIFAHFVSILWREGQVYRLHTSLGLPRGSLDQDTVRGNSDSVCLHVHTQLLFWNASKLKLQQKTHAILTPMCSVPLNVRWPA